MSAIEPRKCLSLLMIPITLFKKTIHVPNLFYNGIDLSVDDSFVYLGSTFSYNGRFTSNNQRLFDQARKTMFSVLKKLRKL